MPDNLMPVVVSSGLGFGVVAGVVSGICYVFIQGFRSTGTHRDKYGVTNPWQCCVCGAHFSPSHRSARTSSASIVSSGAASELRKFAVCAGCNGHACLTSCGTLVGSRSAWLCKQCNANLTVVGKKDGWFKGILTALQPNAVTVRMSAPSPESTSTTSGNNASTNVQQVSMSVPAAVADDDKEVVRDFIERLVGAMLGADLDDTSVSRIYADAGYLPVTGQTPCTAHASLKNIIRRVLRDASNMAIFKEPQNEAVESPDTTTNRTYEDLLATAILNKVIDNYQHDLRRSSTSTRRSDSGPGNQKRHKRGSNGDQEPRWRHSANSAAGDDTTSISSVEEWCRSESSVGEKYVDHLSFTIQQSIEEISTSDEDQPSNQYLHSHNLNRGLKNTERDKNILREDWEDNWLFSRKGKGSPKPVPVPMLVPNPSTDYRALIGDRDAEDTTDLSETGSDLDETDSVQDIKTILVDSRTVIGGKNLLENINAAYLEVENVIQGNVQEVEDISKKVKTVEECTNGDTGFEDDEVSEARNSTLIDETTYVESDSLGSNTEKDMEYTEKYASIPRQISKDKSPVPSPRKPNENPEEHNNEPNPQLENTTEELKPGEDNEDEILEEEPPVNLRGSYSEKEIQKWRNPVALENNPYSKENLDKRLQEKANTINGNHGFGRDYYIREAKKAAGGRKKFLDEDSNTENSVHDSDKQSLSLTSESSDQNIYTAIPAVIDTEISEENEEVGEMQSLSASRPVSLALSTDSEGVDVKRVYNLETGKVYTYKNNNFAKAIIEDSKSPEGSKCFIKPNELVSSNTVDEVDSKFDENHNKTYENTQKEIKEPIMSISNHISALTSENKNPEPKKEPAITKQEFLQQQISVEPEPEIDFITQKNETNNTSISPELKESSRKYLQSLIKNKLQPEVVTNFSTPPVSLLEYEPEKSIDTPQENTEITTETLIDLYDNSTENDVQTEDSNVFFKDYKSCIDLRHINEEGQTSFMEDLTSAPQSGFATSTPNLYDETLYYPEDELKENEQKVNITSELDELNTIGKVKDLKKLFDNDKSPKATISRTKSHLTTKPELRAHRQIHSLTARSLSKEFRRDILPQLQKSGNSNDEKSIELNGVDEEEKQEDITELKEIPPCKSKIAFFELLKNN